MNEPIYFIRRNDTGEIFHFDGQKSSWIPKSHETMTKEMSVEVAKQVDGNIEVVGYVPLDLLRRCIEAFKEANSKSLDSGGTGCHTLDDFDNHWECPDTCPICEAVRVLGMDQ